MACRSSGCIEIRGQTAVSWHSTSFQSLSGGGTEGACQVLGIGLEFESHFTNNILVEKLTSARFATSTLNAFNLEQLRQLP